MKLYSKNNNEKKTVSLCNLINTFLTKVETEKTKVESETN